jgi:hypothetical protein
VAPDAGTVFLTDTRRAKSAIVCHGAASTARFRGAVKALLVAGARLVRGMLASTIAVTAHSTATSVSIATMASGVILRLGKS